MLIKCYLSHSQHIVRTLIYLRPYRITPPCQHVPIKTEGAWGVLFLSSLLSSVARGQKRELGAGCVRSPALFSDDVQLYWHVVTQMDQEWAK